VATRRLEIGGGLGGFIVFLSTEDLQALAGVDPTTRLLFADSPYTVLAADRVIFCNTAGGTIVVNLPAGIEGTYYKIINTSSAVVTINGSGGETVFGAASQTLADGEVLELHFNADEGWW